MCRKLRILARMFLGARLWKGSSNGCAPVSEPPAAAQAPSCSKQPELALAVAFSRALYDCATLDDFPVDPKGTASSHHDSSPAAHTSPSTAELDDTLGRAQVQTQQLATQFGRMHRLCSADDINTSSVHAIVLSFGSAVTANLGRNRVGGGRPVTDLCHRSFLHSVRLCSVS